MLIAVVKHCIAGTWVQLHRLRVFTDMFRGFTID